MQLGASWQRGGLGQSTTSPCSAKPTTGRQNVQSLPEHRSLHSAKLAPGLAEWESRSKRRSYLTAGALAHNSSEAKDPIDVGQVASGGLRAISESAAEAAEAAQHRDEKAAADKRNSSSVSGNHSGITAADVSVVEGEARLRRAGDLLRMVHRMAPADPLDFNRALIIWQAIRDVPAALRHRLLELVTARDITRLWETSQQRYAASASAVAAAIGPEYSQWDDFPMDPGQVATFEGRAAAPVLPWLAGALRVDRFRKQFFLHPDSEELMGRLDVGYGPVGAALYPTYFRATVGSTMIPATLELADIQLDYMEPASLSLSKQDLPNASWPRPKAPRWPFSNQLSDYMRAVGPGVYVGSGWHGTQPDERRQFLTFLLVNRPKLPNMAC